MSYYESDDLRDAEETRERNEQFAHDDYRERFADDPDYGEGDTATEEDDSFRRKVELGDEPEVKTER